MSFSRYPQYKDSGTDWLGQVPRHWTVKPLRHISNIRKGRLPGETFPISTSDTDLPYLSMEFLRGDTINPAFVGAAPNLVIAKDGDILLLWDGSNAGEFLKAKHGVVSSTVALIEPKDVERNFLFFACKAHERHLKDKTIGMGIPHVSGDELRSSAIPYPETNEQTAIAAFLDRETAKIDALVGEQRRLMELLKEKRQAVISHAVTRGLNPDAAFKPSGIGWLGEVPKHWEVSKFGRLASVVRGGSPRPAGDPTLFNGDYSPWVTVAEITKDDKINLTETSSFLTKLGSEQCRVFSKGTLLLSNSGGSLGVPKILQIDANANDGVLGFERLSLNPVFAYFYLSTLTEYLRETVKRTGGSTQINLNTDLLKQLPVPVPPPDEADRIVKYVCEQVHDFDTLTAEAQRAIDLLQERRTALISAAVTGQIKVV